MAKRERIICDQCFPTPVIAKCRPFGTSNGRARYRCRACGGTFSLAEKGERRVRLHEKLEKARLLFARGEPMKAIAARLRVSKNTVTRWRTEIFRLGSIKNYRES